MRKSNVFREPATRVRHKHENKSKGRCTVEACQHTSPKCKRSPVLHREVQVNVNQPNQPKVNVNVKSRSTSTSKPPRVLRTGGLPSLAAAPVLADHDR